jgi:hypothetical protein
MPENRIRLGPFALKSLQKYSDRDAKIEGKQLDEMLINIFEHGGAFKPGTAERLDQKMANFPDWEDYQERLVKQIYVGTDGIGDEVIYAFKAMNERIDGLERDLDMARRNTELLLEKFREMTEDVGSEAQLSDVETEPKPNRITVYWRKNQS